MKLPRSFAPSLLALVCLVTAAAPVLAGEDWKPVDPAHLALKAPMVEKDADAEAIFWEVRVQDEATGGDPRTVLSHYVRIKIFTERGRESQSKIDIFFLNRVKIKDIAGRTIKADGTIIELKKDAVFEREVIRVSGLKIKAKAFAMPGVEPGSIIEYRWREERGDHISFYDRLEFQREIPVQLVKYYVKPLSIPGFPYGMRTMTFHGENTPFVKEKDGFFSTTMTNVPAFHEEPRMPPEHQVRPWMLVYYAEDKKLTPEKFWKELGKEVYDRYKSSMKVNDEVRKAATEAVGDASAPEQKLERLYDYCRAKVKNINDDSLGLSREDRAKMKENKSPADTLKRGWGTGRDINLLFAALATAVGFEAHYARIADRSDTFFDPSFPDDYFLRAYNIAVRVGQEWRFFDPGSKYIPFGMLRWQEEGQQALITDPKDATFVATPLSPAEKSQQKRTAKLRLSEDGTLEGDVRVEYTGHFAVERKNATDDESPDRREENLRNQLKSQMSTAELSDIRIENVTDWKKPFVYAYHVRIPGYAERTGKRLFLQPAFFQRGVAALFSTSGRKHPVYFHYPWLEEDAVSIDLPPGFALDNAEAPASFTMGEVGSYTVNAAITKDQRTLEYKRSFRFNGLLFPPNIYAQLKQAFDAIHQQDNHTITLKQGAATASK